MVIYVSDFNFILGRSMVFCGLVASASGSHCFHNLPYRLKRLGKPEVTSQNEARCCFDNCIN